MEEENKGIHITGGKVEFHGPVSVGDQANAAQYSAAASAPKTRLQIFATLKKRPFLTTSLILAIMLILVIGGFTWVSSHQSSINQLPNFRQRVQVSPIDKSIVDKAMSYYNQYITGSPKQVVIPSQKNGWFSGSPAYGTCTDKGVQEGYHAKPLLSVNTTVCVAPSPNLSDDYALQSTLTVEPGGDGAGLAFGFVPILSASQNFNGNFYYFGYCGSGKYGCSPGNVFLDHLQNGQHVQCMGPEPDATYSTGSDACNVTSSAIQGATNTLTVIILHGTIYLYMNNTFIFNFTPDPPVAYSTVGLIGFIAISGDVTCPQIKIWTF